MTHSVPVIRGGNLNEGRFSDNDFVFLTDEKANQLHTANAFPNDIIFTHRGTLGQVGIIPTNAKYPRYVVSQSGMKLTCNENKADPLYVFYFFRSQIGQHELLKHASQTGVPAIASPLTTLKAIKISLPPLPIQRRIANILGAFDDKIECNRRINQTLETMAQALYKHWFVDFGPFRGGEFVDSELGRIPKGWSVGKLFDILSLRRESIDPGEQIQRLPYLPIDCLPMRSIALSESKDGEEAQSSLILFHTGDILFGAMRVYFHRVCIAPFTGVTRTTTFVLSPRQEYDFAFALLTMNQDATIDFADSHSKGSTIPYAVWEGSLVEMPIVLPPFKIREKFNTTVQPILWQIANSFFENQTLTRTRDYLLPKLLSGEVEVKAAEREL